MKWEIENDDFMKSRNMWRLLNEWFLDLHGREEREEDLYTQVQFNTKRDEKIVQLVNWLKNWFGSVHVDS